MGELIYEYLPKFQTARIQKNGGTFGVYLPKEYVNALKLSRGSHIAIYLAQGVICIQPILEQGFMPNIRATG